MLATDPSVDPRSTNDAALSIRLLGEFSLHRGGQRLPRITLRKSEQILAYLVLHPERDLDRALPVGTFWPDVDRDTARKSLRPALVSIRVLLEPRAEDRGQVLVTPHLAIRFNSPPACSVDAREFEQVAREALHAAV